MILFLQKYKIIKIMNKDNINTTEGEDLSECSKSQFVILNRKRGQNLKLPAAALIKNQTH